MHNMLPIASYRPLTFEINTAAFWNDHEVFGLIIIVVFVIVFLVLFFSG